MKAVAVVAGIAACAVLGVTLNARRASGVPTPPAEDLPSPTGPGAAEPNLTVDRKGHVYLSWHEPLDSGSALKFAVFDGKAWSEARTIRSGRDFFVNWADFPSLHIIEDGRIAAHWLQRTGASTYAYGVRIAMSTDQGRTWSAPITPHADTANTEHGFVSMWSEGPSLRATWLDGRKFPTAKSAAEREMMVMRGIINADGKAMDNAIDTRACDCCQTSAAMTSKGPIIAYRDRSADEIRDIYVVRRVERVKGANEWLPGVPVHRDGWRVNFCPVNGPSVDARDDRVALAWFTAANDTPRVKLALSTDAGATFNAPLQIDDGNPTGRVHTRVLSDGSALVTWIEKIRGDTAEVRLRRVQKNGRAGPATTISTSTAARTSGFPRMAVSDGNVIFAWTSPGRPSAIRVSRLRLSSIR